MLTQRLFRFEIQNFLVYSLFFLYFYTLSADLLSFPLVLFRIKASFFFALILLAVSLPMFKHFHLPQSAWYSFFFLFFSILISSFFSVLPYRSFAYVALFAFQFFCYFLVPLQLVLNFDQEKIFKLYWLGFLLTGFHAFSQLFLSFFGIIDPFVRQHIGKLARPHAMTYEPSYYALYMCTFVMFYNAKVLLENKSILRSKKVWSMLGLNLLLLLSTSTGAFFAYFFFLGVGLFFSLFTVAKKQAPILRKKLRFFFFFLCLFFSILYVIFPQIFNIYFLKFFIGAALKHGSFMTRWEGIVNAWEIFVKNPIFGVGLGGVGPLIHQNDILQGAGIKELDYSEIALLDPTNVLTEVLASLGLFGLCGFIFLGFAIYIPFKKALQNPFVTSSQKNTCIALMISLVTSMLVLQFNQNIFRTYLWVHTALCYGIFLKLSSKRSTEIEPV